MQKITVEGVAKKPTVWTDETFYRVLFQTRWIGLHGLGDHVPVKGEVYGVEEIRETKSKDKKMTFYDAAVTAIKPSVQQPVAETPPKSIVASVGDGRETIFVPTELKAGIRTTPYTQPLSQWERVVDAGFTLADKHNVTEDAARVSLVACLTIPFGEGKLVVDSDWIPPEPRGLDLKGQLLMDKGLNPPDFDQREKALDSWRAEAPSPKPTLYERSKPHTELEAACLQYGGMCVPTKLPTSILFGVSGTRNVLELSVAEAIECLGKVEKLIEDNADWKTKLLLSIKKCCEVKNLDYDIQKWEILYNCTGTRSYQGLDQLVAKKGLLVLKEKYWPEMP